MILEGFKKERSWQKWKKNEW